VTEINCVQDECILNSIEFMPPPHYVNPSPDPNLPKFNQLFSGLLVFLFPTPISRKSIITNRRNNVGQNINSANMPEVTICDIFINWSHAGCENWFWEVVKRIFGRRISEWQHCQAAVQ